MAVIPVRLRCSCGAAAARAAAEFRTWTCPACGIAWRPDPAAVRTVAHAAAQIRRLRAMIGLVLLVALAISAAVTVIRPAWVLATPLIVGGAVMAAAPTYRRRRREVLAPLRTPIPLSAL